MENLYQESGLNYIHATGVPGAPAGTVAVSAIKTRVAWVATCTAFWQCDHVLRFPSKTY